jgi:hypothetical protein
MSVAELIQSVEFLVDATGHKKAVMLDMAMWEEIVAILEKMEPTQDQNSTKARHRLLKAVAESRQAYQSGQVKRGTADDLIAEITA